jgi:hypothetical protein
MNGIRSTRFIGCTGVVITEEDSNDRLAEVYDLY